MDATATPTTRTMSFPAFGVGAGSLANAGGASSFVDTIRSAWEAGIRYFDTAAFYLGGESERRLGEALAGVPRADLLVSTKVGRYQDHAGPSFEPSSGSRYDYSREATLRSVERSLERLGLDRLAAVFIHDLNPGFAGDQYHALFRQALDETLPALLRLRDDGVVGKVGVAAMDWRSCLDFLQAGEADIVMPAGEYTLLRRGSGPLLSHCLRNGTTWIAASPFNSGVLATGSREGAFYQFRPAGPEVMERVSRIEALCRRHGVGIAAAAMQYPLRHPAIGTVVFGAKSASELAANLALVEAKLPAAFWNELEAHLDRELPSDER